MSLIKIKQNTVKILNKKFPSNVLSKNNLTHYNNIELVCHTYAQKIHIFKKIIFRIKKKIFLIFSSMKWKLSKNPKEIFKIVMNNTTKYAWF